MAGQEIDPLLFPGFRLIVEIGRGEAGVVWRARELESQRLVALKIYRPELVRRAGFISGLDAAVVASRGFSHPACARNYGLVEAKSGGGLALITELLGGEVLGRALQRNVRFAPDRALRLARQMAEGLAAAGTRRLVLGTLHPGHVVISGESAKLLGVGTGAVEGLPARYDHAPEEGRFAAAVYAAPEVISGQAPDARSDIFALGALLYHMLTGLPPFRAKDLPGLKLERAEGLRWPRGAGSLIPSEALGLVGRCLETDPALRPSADNFAAAADRILAARGEPAEGVDERASTRMDLAAVPGSTAVLPPSEPRRAGTGGTSARGKSLRDLLLGAVAASVFIAAGLLLGRYVWRTSEPAPPPETRPPVSAPPTVPQQPPPAAPAPSAEDQAAQREFEAISAELAGKPASLSAIKDRLAELASKHSSSEWGKRAGLKLAELLDAERAGRAGEYRKLAERAAEIERRERFGEAAAVFERLPESLAGSELAPRAAAEAAAIRKRAADRYELLAQRAERSVADGDLAAAMLDYKRAAEEFGIPELASAASKRLAELGRIQEQNAQEIARRREEERRARAATALQAALESARAHLLLFRYRQALEILDKTAADKEQPEDSRKLLAGYREQVRGEQKLFDLASRRVATGIRELNITVGDSEVLTIKKLDEKGLVADGAQVSGVVFTWERINKSSPYQGYLAVKKTIDLTSAEEQMQLAVCAFNHEQAMEVENCLKVAVELDPTLKDAAAAQREIFRQVEAVLKPRRAGGGEEAPRRKPPEPPTP